MSSREFDDMLDDLLQQALYPFTEAKPPVKVWRRVLRAVRSTHTGPEASIDYPVLAGLLAIFSRCWGFLSRMRESNVTYVPLFSNRAYYFDQNGRCLPSPFWDMTLTQMFDLRLAS
jgi:hypothetical protein